MEQPQKMADFVGQDEPEDGSVPVELVFGQSTRYDRPLAIEGPRLPGGQSDYRLRK